MDKEIYIVRESMASCMRVWVWVWGGVCVDTDRKKSERIYTNLF